ncbi:ricin-type beta-trefoil lectin protein [Streptomyces sp. TLI_235]|nr:RICIN domain-containing protein [Streptomyces sp. TLI_235]PBC69597.1 ricin-type beta-trefoil lectin protein [Streptomyces sp. TLI_235]
MLRRTHRTVVRSGLFALAASFAFETSAAAYSDVTNASQQVVTDGGRVPGKPSGGGGAQVRLHTITAGAGKCLGMAPPARLGAPLVLWDCGTATVQTFTQQDNGDGTWSFSVPGSTPGSRFCMDSIAGRHDNGTPIGFYPCSGANDQKWVVGPRSQLQAVDSPGKCADERFSRTDNGTAMWMWDCANDPGPIPAGVGRLPVPGVATTTAPKPSLSPLPTPKPSASATASTAATSPPALASAPAAPNGPGGPLPDAPRVASAQPTPIGAQPSGASGPVVPALVSLCVLLLLWRVLSWRSALPAWLSRRAPSAGPLRWRTDRVTSATGEVEEGRSSALSGASPDPATAPAGDAVAAEESSGAVVAPLAAPSGPAPGPGAERDRWSWLLDLLKRFTARRSAVAGPDSSSAEPAKEADEVEEAEPAEESAGDVAGATGTDERITPPTGPGTSTTQVRPEGSTISAGVVFDAPDDALDVAAIAPWWQPDPDLFAVFVRYDGLASAFRIGARVLSPLRLGELVRSQQDWQARPIVLVAQGRIGGWAVQLIADQLQVPVVSGDQRGWWAMLPQRPDRGWLPVVRLAGSWPFSEADKARLQLPAESGTTAQPVRTTVQAIAIDGRGLALLEPDQPGAQELLAGFDAWRGTSLPGRFGVAVQRSTREPGCPYVVGDKPRTVWEMACELWRLREQWQGSEGLVLFTDTAGPDQDAERGLLSAYLQIPVVDTGHAGDESTTRPVSGIDGTVVVAAEGSAVQSTEQEAVPQPDATEPPKLPEPAALVESAPAPDTADGEEALTAALLAPPSLRPDHSSTFQERSLLREALLRRYDVHARAIAQTLATNPGLRGALPEPADGSDMGDLVAVRALVCGDLPTEPDGRRSPRVDAVWAACVSSGLRRLPSYRGPVHCQGLPVNWELEQLAPGRVLHSPQVLRASQRPPLATNGIVTAMWSTGGRRAGVLAVSGAAEEVILPGNSLFRVLGTVKRAGGETVLMRELPASERPRQEQGDAGAVLNKEDLTIRALLLAWLGPGAPVSGLS